MILSKVELNLKKRLNEKGWKDKDATSFIQKAHYQNEDVVEKLIKENALTSQQICNIIAEQTGKNIVELNFDIINKELNKKYKDSCKRHNYLFLKTDQDSYCITASNPENKEMIAELNYFLKGDFNLHVSKYNSLIKHIEYIDDATFKNNQQDLILSNENDEYVVDLTDTVDEPDSQHNNIKNLTHILEQALKKGASDIHIEPKEQYELVRYRIDGKMFTIDRYKKEDIKGIIARIKVLAGLDITVKREPQEGRFSSKISKEQVDFRVSILPLIYGEKVVIRVLDNLYSNIGIHKIGMSEDQQSAYFNSLNKKQGMILITGPTGAGKSITLFSGLSALPHKDINIITAESPVEVQLDTINQININENKGLSYPDALRYILRQDPDVIMVGEIRDTETLDISLKAAQTGHLVLSTLHAKDPFQTFERLENMNESLFNIVNSLNLICSQRLFRKLCPNCRKQKTVTKGMEKEFFSKGINLKEGELYYIANDNGCDECHDGHLGRIALFETLEMDDEIREALLNKEEIKKIRERALNKGHKQMKDIALEKVKEGVISIDQFFVNIY